LVFLGNSVEASEIDAESKRAVFLPNKRGPVLHGVNGMDGLTCSKVFVNELTQSGKFLLGQGVIGP